MAQRAQAKRIGFVPTMGALHAGHLALIEAAAAEYDLLVCSIFVNPTQFNDPKDLERYPRTLQADVSKLLGSKLDYLFVPDVLEVYPADFQPESFDFGALGQVLEGEHRPGHFDGVGMVVARLLHIVEPDGLIMGEKDFQQCAVVGEMLRQMGWQDRVQLHVVETRREEGGLAMSSRNLRLSPKGLAEAAHIYAVMQGCKERYQQFTPDQLSVWATHSLDSGKYTRTEYVVFADAVTLRPVQRWNESPHVRVLIAAWVEDVRLIDNALLF